MDIDAEFKSVAKKSNPCAGLIASNLPSKLIRNNYFPLGFVFGFRVVFCDRSIDRSRMNDRADGGGEGGGKRGKRMKEKKREMKYNARNTWNTGVCTFLFTTYRPKNRPIFSNVSITGRVNG